MVYNVNGFKQLLNDPLELNIIIIILVDLTLLYLYAH